MKRTSKILLFVITVSLLLCITMFAASAEAINGACGANVAWSYDTETNALVISGSGEMNDYSSTNMPWKNYKDSVITIEIKDSVTTIGNNAFYGCANVETVDLAGSTKSIGQYAFYGCTKLKEIELPENLETISNCSFRNCSELTTITIPDSVTSIGYAAFGGCSSLEEMTIPFVGGSAKTDDTSRYPFGYIFGVDSYTGSYGAGSQYYHSVSSYSSTNTYYMPSSLKKVTLTGGTILTGAFENCSGLTEVEIPNDTVSIGTYAFRNCTSLTTVNIPESVKSIGSYAFYNCENLTNVVLPKSLEVIGDNVFNNCKGIRNITELSIPEGVTSIGDRAFYGWNFLTKITIPNSVTSIGYAAFGGCSSLEEMTIPFVGGSAKTDDTSRYPFGYIFGVDSYTGSYGAGSQYYHSVSSYSSTSTYYMPSSLKKVTLTGGTILTGAFENCSGLTEVEIPNDTVSIGTYAFRNCTSLTTVNIPESVKNIGSYAFYNCKSLPSIDLPNGVESIGSYAYKGCNIPSSITLPSSLRSIGEYAFSECTMLKKIVVEDVSTWLNISFGSKEANPMYYGGEVYVGDELLTDVIVPDGIETINDFAFYGYSKLSSIRFSETVKSIGNSAFYNCASLSRVTTTDGLEQIGNNAFYGCTGITRLSIPSTVKSIGSDAFYGCTGLTRVNISDFLSWCEIDFSSAISNPLYYAKKLYLNSELLTSTVLPGTITELKPYCFYNCVDLAEIIIPDNIIKIGRYALYGCSSLTELIVPDSVEEMGYACLKACSKLQSLSVPFAGNTAKENVFIGYIFGADSYSYNSNNVPSSLITVSISKEIGPRAFYGCNRIKNVTIGEEVTAVGEYAFYGCSSIQTITVPNNVKTVGNYAFSNCSDLEEIIFGNNVTTLPAYTLSNCSKLKRVCCLNNGIDTYAISTNSLKEGTTLYAFNNGDNKEIAEENGIIFVDLSVYDCENDKHFLGYYESIIKEVPTCVNEGSEETMCLICGQLIESRIDINPLNHNYETVLLDDYHTQNNIFAYVCSYCEQERTPGKQNMTFDSTDYPESEHDYSNRLSRRWTYNTPVQCEKIDITFNSNTRTEEDFDFIRIYTLSNVLVGTYSGTQLSGKTVTVNDSGFIISLDTDGIGTYYGFSIDSITGVGEDTAHPTSYCYIETLTNPTCTTDGARIYTCNSCGVFYEEKIDCLGHNMVIIEAKDPTCTEDGCTYGEYCTRCDYSIESETIPAYGHNYNISIITHPTCTINGLLSYECEICHDSYTRTTNLSSHTIVIDAAVSATCTQTGLTEGEHCSICGEVLKAQETVPATGHKNVTLQAVAATCEKAGKTAGSKCSVCGKITKTQTSVPATGHKEVILKAVKATTSKSGLTEGKKCSVCGKILVAQKTTLAQVTGVKASSVKATSIKLSWTKVAGAKYYKVEQSTDGKTWKAIATVSTNSATIKSLKAGTKYQFRVTALDTTKKIAGKASATFKTGTLTAAPTVTVKSTKSKTAVASWKKVTGASKYIVYKSTDGKKWDKGTTTTKTSLTLSKLTGGKKIYVKVVAVNAYGKKSTASTIKNVTVKK